MKLVSRKNLTKGFTLLELLVVISIMGILIALATVSYTSAQKKTRDAKRKGDMKTIQNAMEQYYAENKRYAYSDGFLKTMFPSNSLPTDPKGGTDFVYVFTYDAVTPFGETYCACAHLEIANSGNATNGTCTYDVVNRDYFCVSELQ